MSAADFDNAVKFVQTSTGIKLSTETKLAFYALFKQATDGPCTVKAPSRLKIADYTKWKGWNALGNISKEEAKKRYVEALTKAVPNWNVPQAKL